MDGTELKNKLLEMKQELMNLKIATSNGLALVNFSKKRIRIQRTSAGGFFWVTATPASGRHLLYQVNIESFYSGDPETYYPFIQDIEQGQNGETAWKISNQTGAQYIDAYVVGSGNFSLSYIWSAN